MNKNKKGEFARRILAHLAAIVLAVMIVVPAVSANAAAASSVSVTGGDNVAGGETFTVTVTYSGDSVGRVVADMTYDKSMLTYISGGTSLGNNGYIQLENAGTGENLVFNIKFQALKDGNTSIKVNTSEIYDLDEQYMSVPAAVTKNVAISGNASDDEIVEPSTAPEGDYEVDLISVDEKEAPVNFTLVLAIGAAVAVLLIVIIAVAIRRKK